MYINLNKSKTISLQGNTMDDEFEFDIPKPPKYDLSKVDDFDCDPEYFTRNQRGSLTDQEEIFYGKYYISGHNGSNILIIHD